MKEYTPVVDGFQIRDMVYIGFDSDGNYESKEAEKDFDIVKWVKCDPYNVIDAKTGKGKTIDQYCYSVGCLEWDEKEEDFNFKSIGLRWLESNPSMKVIKMILGFCEMMTPILENND